MLEYRTFDKDECHILYYICHYLLPVASCTMKTNNAPTVWQTQRKGSAEKIPQAESEYRSMHDWFAPMAGKAEASGYPITATISPLLR